jgi:hypothetical protein
MHLHSPRSCRAMRAHARVCIKTEKENRRREIFRHAHPPRIIGRCFVADLARTGMHCGSTWFCMVIWSSACCMPASTLQLFPFATVLPAHRRTRFLHVYVTKITCMQTSVQYIQVASPCNIAHARMHDSMIRFRVTSYSCMHDSATECIYIHRPVSKRPEGDPNACQLGQR